MGYPGTREILKEVEQSDVGAISSLLDVSSSSSTVKGKVYDGILNGITTGEIRSGTILTEKQVGDEYGASKSPVREALAELCKDEIIRSIPRTGYEVIPVTLRQVNEIVELRADIEVMGMERAFPKITSEKIETLNKINSFYNDCENNISKSWGENRLFHLYLYSLNGNEYGFHILENLIKKTSIFISQYYYSCWDGNRPVTSEKHRGIVEALEHRDLEKAKTLLQADVRSVGRELFSLHQ